MTAAATSYPVSDSVSSAPRVLGVVGMLASPMFLILWLVRGTPAEGPPTLDPTSTLLGIAYLAGFAASVVAMRLLRVTGQGRGAAMLFVVQLLGLTLALSQQVQDLAKVRPLGDLFYGVSDVAWPLSHVLMLAVFVAVLRARVWTDWRRWAPLACGLVLPATMLAASVGGRGAMGAVFGPGTALSFLALGLAVFTARAR